MKESESLMLAQPPQNLMEHRRESPIPARDVSKCKCGAIPSGVYFAPDQDEPESGGTAVIECQRCHSLVMTSSVDQAKQKWNSLYA